MLAEWQRIHMILKEKYMKEATHELAPEGDADEVVRHTMHLLRHRSSESGKVTTPEDKLR